LGSWFSFLGLFLGKYRKQKGDSMIKKNYKGRCIKKSVSKAKEVCRTYNGIQLAYLDKLQADEAITEIKCNIPLDGEIEEYSTDFLCVKSNGDLMVRECVYRKHLLKPLTVKLLDASRLYWLNRGVNDWGLIIDEEQ
jgi:hypothetical protein